MNSKARILIYWVPVMLWMSVIFSASGDQNSMHHSSRILGPIIRFFHPGISDPALGKAVFIGRKIAHLTVFAVLASLLWIAFVKTFDVAPSTWSWRVVRWTIGLVLIYAALDELHQTFVPTRQGSPWDVLIDVGGGVLGLVLIWSAGRWRRKW